MNNVLLREFNASIIGKGRITFGDVKRLQRNILPDGIMDRDEVELLVSLDRLVARSDAAFAEYLVRAVTEFVVWGERPTGTVDATTGRWLKDLLFAEEPTRTALRIAGEVEKEAQFAEGPAPARKAAADPAILAAETVQPAALA